MIPRSLWLNCSYFSNIIKSETNMEEDFKLERMLMVRKNIFCIFISAFIMLLLPWCAITFVKGDGGMAVCFLLFFVVNPILSIGVGIFSGRNIKVSWFQPLLCAMLFVIGTWTFFEIGEISFIIYAGVYLILGYVSTTISWLISRMYSKINKAE